MDSSTKQFGLIVAYLLPGLIGLAGIAPFVPVIRVWLAPLNQAESSLGAPLYAVLAAFTVGMILSCFRWLIIDHIHHWSGTTPPAWNDAKLVARVDAFNYLVENHYRYYQFYSNALISIVFAYSINRFIGASTLLGVHTDIGVFILCVGLFVGSHDSLSKYYGRTTRLMGETPQKGSASMTNGNHLDSGGTTSAKTPQTTSVPKQQPAQSVSPRQQREPKK